MAQSKISLADVPIGTRVILTNFWPSPNANGKSGFVVKQRPSFTGPYGAEHTDAVHVKMDNDKTFMCFLTEIEVVPNDVIE